MSNKKNFIVRKSFIFYNLCSQAISTIWIVPVVMVLAALVLSLVVFWLNMRISLHLHKNLYSYDAAKTILLTCLSLTVAILSVSLSVIVMMLTTTANQVGPRLLKNIIKQSKVQFCLGFFVAVFVFCMASLFLIRWDPMYLPTLFIAILLIIINALLLIYLIDYVKNSIQTDTLIANIAADIEKTILACCNPKKKKYQPYCEKEFGLADYQNKSLVKSVTNGYIQTIDYKKLLKIACENDLIIKLIYRPGQYIWHSLQIAEILYVKDLGEELIDSKINSCIITGKNRTMTQDFEFCFEELAEIAIRSMSPNLANPFTVINAIDRMFSGFAYAANYNFPPSVYYEDDKQKVRLLTASVNYQSLIKTCFYRLTQEGSKDILIACRLVNGINELLQTLIDDEVKALLLSFVDDFYQEAKNNISFTPAVKELTHAYEKIIR